MLLGWLVMLRRLVMLWDRNMHIRNVDVGDVDIRNMDVRNMNVRNMDIRDVHWRNVDVGHMYRRNLDLVMAAIMTMAWWWWCTSFLSPHSFNSLHKNLRHYFSLPPRNIVLGTVGLHAVLSNRPCRVALIVLATVRA